MDILIIKPYWVDRILKYHKTWEIRGSKTTKRGTIALAKSGTGQIFGEVDLVGCIPLTRELWEQNSGKHQVPLKWEELLMRYKTPYAWVFDYSTVFQYDEPKPYDHPKGAVIWVKHT